MEKPCLESHGEYREGCRVCYLWKHDPRYAAIRTGGNSRLKRLSAPVALPCIYRGPQTGEKVGCQTCKGNVQLTLFACEVHGDCTLGKRVEGHGCCDPKCAERVEPG